MFLGQQALKKLRIRERAGVGVAEPADAIASDESVAGFAQGATHDSEDRAASPNASQCVAELQHCVRAEQRGAIGLTPDDHAAVFDRGKISEFHATRSFPLKRCKLQSMMTINPRKKAHRTRA